jgi:hypothetical protein
MFNTLEEQIDQTQDTPPSTSTRAMRYAGVLAVTALIFGVLFVAIRLLD